MPSGSRIVRSVCAQALGTATLRLRPCQLLARRRLPVLGFLIALGVAIERALEIAEGDDEARPAVPESAFEDVVLDERPQPMAEGARHRDALAGELVRAKRRVAVHLADHLLHVAERKLVDRILQVSERLRAQ